MAEATARELRNSATAGSYQWSERKSDLVTDTTCRVLISGLARERRPIHALATIYHGICPARYFTHVHTIEQDRHQKSGHLFIGYNTTGVRIDNPINLWIAQLTVITLGANDFNSCKWFGHFFLIYSI